MPDIDMIDASDSPRSEHDLLQALTTCRKHLVKSRPPSIPADLFIELTTIKDAIEELRARRAEQRTLENLLVSVVEELDAWIQDDDRDFMAIVALRDRLGGGESSSPQAQ